MAEATDESLQSISSSRKSPGQGNGAAEVTARATADPGTASSCFSILATTAGKREMIPDGSDTPFHQDSHERILLSSSKCHFNAATVHCHKL